MSKQFPICRFGHMETRKRGDAFHRMVKWDNAQTGYFRGKMRGLLPCPSCAQGTHTRERQLFAGSYAEFWGGINARTGRACASPTPFAQSIQENSCMGCGLGAGRARRRIGGVRRARSRQHPHAQRTRRLRALAFIACIQNSRTHSLFQPVRACFSMAHSKDIHGFEPEK